MSPTPPPSSPRPPNLPPPRTSRRHPPPPPATATIPRHPTQDIKKQGAIIFVYPKACTSGCTFQANGFKDSSAAFAAKGYQVYGLSADVPEAQAGWKAEHGFGYPLLSDPSMAVLREMGCVSAEGKITRAHFVVAPGGAVEDAQVGVSSKESVPLALAFVGAK
jgi:peroxiredoxin Q/BCP